MRVTSPIITLIVGVLLAVVIYILSVNSKPASPTQPYGAGIAAVAVPR
ncbi:MAG TPA: hypothetical protein VGF84_16170 [Micromonosporaceae bacterium]